MQCGGAVRVRYRAAVRSVLTLELELENFILQGQ